MGSLDYSLYAFDAKSGAQKWSFPTRGKIYSSPIVADGMIYVGSADGNAYAFHLTE
ncbi:MAG: PQQ-binding-like beta-propeller repeat protein [Ktedonobacteraceae bacterium]